MPTEKAITVYGEVDYETVECSSCETEVLKEEAQRFVVGDVRRHKSLDNRGIETYAFKKGTVRDGWACEFCVDDPAGFPGADILPELSKQEWMEMFALVWALIFMGILMISIP